MTSITDKPVERRPDFRCRRVVVGDVARDDRSALLLDVGISFAVPSGAFANFTTAAINQITGFCRRIAPACCRKGCGQMNRETALGKVKLTTARLGGFGGSEVDN